MFEFVAFVLYLLVTSVNLTEPDLLTLYAQERYVCQA